MKIIIIIPTYNEKDSIGQLIDAVEKEFSSEGGSASGRKNSPKHQLSILIVDGNSPDDTAEIVRNKAEFYENIDLFIEKEKRGLGMAYIVGMKYAIEQLGADAIIEFDGDFQHDPADIKRLIAEFDNGYDYVIGSRYVAGGSIPKAWPWYRKLLSRFGSLYIKWVLCLPTNDNTSGFKLSRVKGFAEGLPLDENKILSRQFAYKIHLLYEMIKMGAKVKEIPIKFLERGGGSSKSSMKDIFESLRVVSILFLNKIKG